MITTNKLSKRSSILLITILTTLILLISINFISATYGWDSSKNTYTFIDNENPEQEIISFAENILVITKNAEITEQDGKKTITIKPRGFIEIKGIKYPIDTSKENQFVFNQNGELIQETKFTTSKDEIYRIKAYDVDLPSQTQVTYEQDKVVFNLPKGSQVLSPEIPEGSKETPDPEQLFVFQSNDEIKLENGRWFKTTDSKEKTTLYYQNNEFYFTNKNNLIKSNDRGDELLIYNSNYNNNENQKKVYLYFNQDNIDSNKNFILLNKDKIILNSLNENGVAVFFASGNRMGIASDSEHTVSAQARNGKVIVTPAKDTKIPNIKINGNSLVNLDKRSFFANENELWFHPSTELIGEFEHGKYDAPIELTLIDKDKDKEENLKNFNVYSNGRDQYASVIQGKFQGPLKSFKTKLGFFVSATVVFNQLTPSAQDFYSKLSQEKQEELLESAGYSDDLDYEMRGSGLKAIDSETSEKTQTAKLQSALNNLIIEEKRRRQNPYLASVKLSSLQGGKGGSAVIFSVDKEGHPLAFTAGHIVRNSGHRVMLTIKTQKGDIKLKGTVIGGEREPDIALIKMDDVIPNIPYVPVGSMSDITVGGLAMRMGYPANKNRAFEAIKTTITKIIGSDQRIRASEKIGPYPGSSGGPLFMNGKLIGITSRAYGWGTGTGGYTNPNQMREFATKLGYGYALNIFLVIIKSFYFPFHKSQSYITFK